MTKPITRSRRQFQCGVTLTVAVLLSGCGTPEQIVGTNWSGPHQTPNGREFTPERLIRERKSGWVLLSCVAGEGYEVDNCKVAGEYPTDEGLGDAALKMRSGLKAGPFTSPGNDLPQAGESVLYPILFCQPDREVQCVQMKGALYNYAQKLSAIEKLLRAGRCSDAWTAATDTEQPTIIRLVAAACIKQPLIIN